MQTQAQMKSTHTGSSTDRARLGRGLMLMAPMVLLVAAGQAMGQTRNWRNAANGTFSAGSNWVGSVAPGAGNTAVFGLNASVNPFTVAFTGNATTAGLTVSNQRPNFNLAGFTYNNTGDTLIGGTNGPVLTVTNGTMNTRAGGGRLYVGNTAGQTGTLVVDGGAIDGLWDIGGSGNGTVTIQNGADATVPTGDRLVIGYNASSVGTLTLTGAGTTLTQSDNTFHVGYQGTATCSILNGASLVAPRISIADQSGIGSLLVDSGGTVACSNVVEVGRNSPQSFGTLTVRGAGSLVTAPSLSTSGGARGDITIENGGRLELPDGTNAWAPGTRQDIVVSGTGSVLTTTSIYSNDGVLSSIRVENGGQLNALHDVNTFDAGTSRSIVITGAGSQFNFGSGGGYRLDCSGGTCSILVGAGGELNGTWLQMSENLPASMSLTIDGPDSSASLYDFTAARGTGDLQILNGAHMTVQNQFQFGCCGTSAPKTLTVSGSGSQLTVGDYPTTNGAFLFGNQNTGTSGIIDQGGTIIVRNSTFVGFYGSATLIVRTGGALESLGGIGIAGWQNEPSEVVVGTGSYIFATGRIDLGSNLPGTEVGILTLDGGTAFTLDYMPILDNGIFRGTGNFEGSIGVNGLVQPGLPLGTLNVTGIGFNNERQPRLDIQIGGTTVDTEFDRLAVTNHATLAGTLSLSLANGFEPAAGQTFDIITAGSMSGQFSTITGTDLGAGKAFVAQYLPDTLRLVVDGVTGVDIAQTTLGVVDGYTEPLTASAAYAISPSQNITTAVTWVSDDPGIATISADGKVTGVSGGTTTIRASYAGFEDSVEVSIVDLPRLQDADPGLVTTIRDTGLLDFDLLTPFLTTSKSSIQFDGGEANTLSGRTTWYGARFTGRLNITAAGDYSFIAGGDDVVSVSIDGNPIAFGRVYQDRPAGTMMLEPGEHDIQVDYSQLDNEGSWMGVDFWGPGIPRQRITSGFLVGGHATLEFFDAPQYPFGNEVPDLNQFHVYSRFITADLNRPIHPGTYNGNMLRYEGDIAIADAGNYTFTVNVDDGATVWLNGTEVLDAWSPFGYGFNHTFSQTFERGVYSIRVDFTAHQGHSDGMVMSIEGPGISKQPIPAAAFTHGGIPAPTCIGDFNQDGGVDGSDIDAFFAEWEAGNSPADVNQDGGVDGSDVGLFFERWEQGC